MAKDVQDLPMEPEICPYTGFRSDECPLEACDTEEHILWHINEMVRQGILFRNPEGKLTPNPLWVAEE